MPQRTIFCVALSRGRAGRIVLDLKEARFSCTEISALFLDQSASTGCASINDASALSGESVIQSPEVTYGVMAWIAAVGCRVIPGGGPVIAAGPIAADLSDGAICGVADGLIGLGVPQAEARRYESKIKTGHILLSVHTKNARESNCARAIFAAAGALDICTTMNAVVQGISTRSGYRLSDTALV